MTFLFWSWVVVATTALSFGFIAGRLAPKDQKWYIRLTVGLGLLAVLVLFNLHARYGYAAMYRGQALTFDELPLGVSYQVQSTLSDNFVILMQRDRKIIVQFTKGYPIPQVGERFFIFEGARGKKMYLFPDVPFS